MGASSLQPTLEEHHGPSNTWPQKCGRRKGGPGVAPAGPLLGELLLYVRNPLVRDIDAECGVAPQASHVPYPKAKCPHLSLGSVLSLKLPQDTEVLGCHRGAAEAQEQKQSRSVRPWEPTGTHGAGWQDEVDMDGHGPQQPSEGLGVSPKSDRGMWLKKVSFNTSYSQQRAHRTGEECCSLQHPSSASEDLQDFSSSWPSHGSVLHEQVSQEGDELTGWLRQYSSPCTTVRATHPAATQLELGLSPAGIPGGAGTVPCTARTQQPAGSSQPGGSLASATAPTELSVFEWALGSPQPPSPVSGPGEACHPAHRQFEEEEEELQAIWDWAGQQGAPSPPADSHACHQLGSRAGSLPSPDTTTSRPLILSSANNVLVAKFTLPTAAQLLHSPSGEKSPSVDHSGGGSPSGHGVSPCPEELTPASPLDGSGTWDQRRQHGEMERESSKVRSRGLGAVP